MLSRWLKWSDKSLIRRGPAISAYQLEHMFQVRREIWAIFGLALAVALFLPSIAFWNTWHAPIVASVILEPYQPVVGQQTFVEVVLHEETQPLARETPIQVATDMVQMVMGTQHLAVPAQYTGEKYRVPLRFTMAGKWWITLRLDLPGHAPWAEQVTLDVREHPSAGT